MAWCRCGPSGSSQAEPEPKGAVDAQAGASGVGGAISGAAGGVAESAAGGDSAGRSDPGSKG